MKSFINVLTGVVETPQNKLVIEQYEKNTELYKEYKPVSEPTLKELKEKADELGIIYKKKVTKKELLELLNSN